MKKTPISSNFYKYILLICTAFITYFEWYSFNNFAFGDLVNFSNRLYILLNEASVLTFSSGLGEFNYSLWNIPYVTIIYFFVNMGFDYTLLQNIFILCLSTLLLPLSCYLFLDHLFKNKFYSLLGATIFSYNPYFISIISQGHLNLILSNALLFFSLTLYIKILKDFDFNKFYLLILVTCYTIYVDLRIIYLGVPIYVFFLLYEVYLIVSSKRNDRFIYILLVNGLLLFFIITLNLFWILPYIFNDNENTILARSLIYNTFNDLSYSILIQHPYWSPATLTWFEKKPFLVYRVLYLIIFVYFIYTLKTLKSNKIILYFFSFLFILGIFLTKMNDLPFPELYTYLYNYLIGFSAFREPTKFFFYIYLGFCLVLTGVLSKNIHPKINRLIVLFLLTDLVIILHPLILNVYDYTYKSKEIPSSYINLENYFTNDGERFNFMYVPSSYYYKIGTHSHIPLSYSHLSNRWGHLRNKNNYFNAIDKKGIAINMLLQEFSNNLINQYGIKYLVIPEDSPESFNSLYSYFGGDRGTYVSLLDGTDYLNKVYIPGVRFDIYENSNYLGFAYKTFQEDVLDSVVDGTVLDYIKVSNTYYKIYVNKDSVKDRKFYLNFITYYDTNWDLYLVDNDKKFKFDNKYMINKESSLMAYYIDDSYIKNNLGSIISTNSGSYEFHLVYEPQKYLTIGLYIWRLVFVILTFFLLVTNLNKFRKKLKP